MKTKLLRAIQRSEFAHVEYKKNKKYFQALRIYKANQLVYQLLEEYLYVCEKEDIEEVCKYLFHLEDWSNQFQYETQNKNIELSKEFVFQRLAFSIPYPKDFKNRLL